MSTWSRGKEWYRKNRKQIIENNTTYKQDNRDRHYAHKYIYSLILNKEIKKPKRCPSCGSNRNIEAYYIRIKPYVKFDWSCRSCSMKRRAGKAVK